MRTIRAARTLVSAIVPSHEHLRYLPERFASIAGQTRPPDELIVIDDASGDGSAEWLRQWRSPVPLRLECRTTPLGNPFAAWNAGARHATGDWLWIAESDDACQPEFLETLLAATRSHPGAAIVFCQSALIDDASRRVGSFLDYTDGYDTETWRGDFVLDGRTAAARLLLARNVIPNVSACLISRRAWDAAGGAAADLSLCGDWLSYGGWLRHGPLVFCAPELNRHRHHAGTQRMRVPPRDFIRQNYVARRSLAELHEVAADELEFPRRYAWHETAVQLAIPPAELADALAGPTLDAALAFDPQFAERGRHPQLRPWNRCEVFSGAAPGDPPATQKQQPVPRLDAWTTLRFRSCTGALRVDPIAHPGRCAIRRLALHDCRDGRAFWTADTERLFHELRVNAGVTTWFREGAWWLESAHEDPQVLLPASATGRATNFDLIVELYCPRE